MKTYVCNVANSGSHETPLLAPIMEFPPPRTPPTRVVNRDRECHGREDADDVQAPLTAPTWTFEKR
jgi:hypothetical protein